MPLIALIAVVLAGAWPLLVWHGSAAARLEAAWVVFLVLAVLVVPAVRQLRRDIAAARSGPATPPAASPPVVTPPPAKTPPAARGELTMNELAARVAASAADPNIAQTLTAAAPPSPIGEADVDVACRYVTENVPGADLLDVEYLGDVDGKPADRCCTSSTPRSPPARSPPARRPRPTRLSPGPRSPRPPRPPPPRPPPSGARPPRPPGPRPRP